ncbi:MULTISPECIES: AraC family transcriptional regulator [Amycolatopsis]|uniref:AraC family transcriptional regulator n=1 Tax=Amycolatopsis thermalba TaxID=944492 RepID=A0ABY4NZG3_9PSEU|nr:MULTISPECIES: AraC family transcriptional regulator [Amycolatopsis]OXM66364.1 hypothetical protein CF166_26595 [Amycolatopsis sp. KNN50.9b]UQS25403.1 AraC family transcriptional regulator [Amycolatopsis thermalba]
MAYRIPASFAVAAVELAVERGIDLPRLLVEAGLSPIRTRPHDLRVTAEQAVRLAVALRRMTGDELFGLGAAPVPRGTLHILSHAMAGVPTLREGIDRLAMLVKPLAGFPDLELEPCGRDHALRLHVPPGAGPLLTVMVAAIADRIIGWAIGRATPKVRVEFPFPEPPNSADIALLLGEEIRYGAGEFPALILPASALASPIAHDEQSVVDYVARAPGEWLASEPGTLPLARRVRQLIERGLARRHIVTAEELAAALTTSVPTLRRQLRQEGSSLREIRDEVLAKTAETALRTTDDPIASIATRLGFSETSAFTRAFHRWTGEAPARYRARLRETS